MRIREKCEALDIQVLEKLRNLRKKAYDKNVPEEDRLKARRKLEKHQAFLEGQKASVFRNGGTKTRLRKA